MLSINPLEWMKWIRERWHYKEAPVIASILTFTLLYFIFTLLNISSLPSWQRYIFYASPILIVAIWIVTNRLPRAKKGTVGFVIAISAEDDQEMLRLKADFIDNLVGLLSSGEMTYPFDVLVYPPHQAKKIKTGEDASRALKKSRARFMLFGNGRIRQIFGKEQHVLHLEGVVRHTPIPKEEKHKFSAEFTELLPRRLLMQKENDLFSFQFSSGWADVVARYIIGIAALISGDMDYSESLFIGLKERLSSVETSVDALKKVKDRIPARLYEINAIRARWNYNKWRSTRDKDYLSKEEIYIDNILRLFPNDYHGQLNKAICSMVLRRDVKDALRRIRAHRKEEDATYRYSYAFLLAYRGKLKKAYNQYKTAFKKKGDDTVPIQAEEFIHEIIEEEPNRTDLYFCLGMINYYAKQDYKQAKHDFELFLSKNDPEKYREVWHIAEQLVAEAAEKI